MNNIHDSEKTSYQMEKGKVGKYYYVAPILAVSMNMIILMISTIRNSKNGFIWGPNIVGLLNGFIWLGYVLFLKIARKGRSTWSILIISYICCMYHITCINMIIMYTVYTSSIIIIWSVIIMFFILFGQTRFTLFILNGKKITGNEYNNVIGKQNIIAILAPIVIFLLLTQQQYTFVTEYGYSFNKTYTVSDELDKITIQPDISFCSFYFDKINWTSNNCPFNTPSYTGEIGGRYDIIPFIQNETLECTLYIKCSLIDIYVKPLLLVTSTYDGLNCSTVGECLPINAKTRVVSQSPIFLRSEREVINSFTMILIILVVVFLNYYTIKSVMKNHVDDMDDTNSG